MLQYLCLVCVLEGTSDSEQVDGVAGHGATQQPLAAELRLDRVVLDVVQVVLSTARGSRVTSLVCYVKKTHNRVFDRLTKNIFIHDSCRSKEYLVKWGYHYIQVHINMPHRP